MSFLDRILRAGEGRTIKKLEGIAKSINFLEPDFEEMSDDELSGMTVLFRERLENGETLDDLLPEAFATVREAARRTLGQRHFDVQLMGGAALHGGNIAEMKTGEGKTLVATLPSYLNALSGKGVHVVTVNDYLASYQSELMGRVFRFLGMSVGCIVTNQEPAVRREQYAADITYGTNNEFGFDYLRDNMAWRKEDLVQREYNFAIVDEVDSILIDEARTPLIISGPAMGDANKWYQEFAKLVRKLDRDEDYEVDEKKKTVGILEPGVEKVEQMLDVDNLYESVNTPLIGYLNNAIRAKELFERDDDYIVKNGEVMIVDEHTGRALDGRRYSEGMHQAIEAKEGVKIKAENQTYATITLQNYFRMYDKLAGMTGTADTEAAEFMGTYNLGVIPIPTNKPMIRADQKDVVFRTMEAKFKAVVEDIAERHEKGQPILCGTVSVEKSEILSRMLKLKGIEHNVLNAKQHAREAAVVALAGKKGMVTVSTNMAGRGTDIMLGGNTEFLAFQRMKELGIDPDDDPKEYEKAWQVVRKEVEEEAKKEHDEIKELGGLYVLGTERHESRRIDNQLRGRSGRQGDPGESRFYLSFEDDLMRLYNTQFVERMMATMNIPDDMPFEYKSMTKSIQKAQGGLEAQHFEIRKNVLKYDEVMNKQRQVMYAERRRVLEGEDLHEKIDNFIDDVISDHITSFTSEGAPEEWDLDALWADLRIIYPIEIEADEIIELVGRIGSLTPKVLTREILSDAHVVYKEREELIGAENMRDLERRVVLSVLDRKWREHLYEMDYLKEGIGLRAMAQRDPLVEYSIEGSRMFDAMNYAIKEEAISFLFNVKFEIVNEVQTPEEQSQEGLSYSAPAENVGGSEFSDVPTGEEGAGGSAGGGSAGGVGASRAERRAAAGGGSGSSGAQKSQRSANEKSMRGEASRPEADGRAFPGTKPNDPCPCGSGKKYKLCHGKNDKDLPAASQGAKSPSKQPLGRPFKQTSKQSAKQTNKSANSKNPSQKGKKKK